LWFLLPFGTSGGLFIRRSLSNFRMKSYATAAGVTFGVSHKVFVHCKVGQCRSPAVVAVFLATQKKVDFATALGWVQAKRNGVYLIPEVMQSADEYVKWYAARPVTNFRIER
jgi:hypothetical protein